MALSRIHSFSLPVSGGHWHSLVFPGSVFTSSSPAVCTCLGLSLIRRLEKACRAPSSNSEWSLHLKILPYTCKNRFSQQSDVYKFKGLALDLLGWPIFNPLPFPSPASLGQGTVWGRKDTRRDPNTDRGCGNEGVWDTRKPCFLCPAAPPALYVTALLNNPLVSSPLHQKRNPPVPQTPGSPAPCAPSPPPSQPPLTPQQGGLLPLPAQMRPPSKGLSITWPNSTTGSPSLFPGSVTSWITHFMPFHSPSSPSTKQKLQETREFCWTYFHSIFKAHRAGAQKNHS